MECAGFILFSALLVVKMYEKRSTFIVMSTKILDFVVLIADDVAYSM